MAAYGFTGEATVSYMECSGTWRYAFRGGRFCCRESNLDMCSSPGSPTDKGMHRHLISGCCRLMGEVIHNSSAWRPSCASNSERRLKLPRPTSPHVVISAAVSTRPASVYNQARSWRFWAGSLRRVYSGDAIVFVGAEGPSPEAAAYARAQRVWLHTKTHIASMMTDRFLLFTSACVRYKWCLTVDFRDALFQGDPFAAIEHVSKGAQVLLMQEIGYRIATEPLNRLWVSHCWGQDMLDKIGNEPPVCGGAIVATPLGMRSVRDAFCKSLWARVDGRVHVCNDQGLLNVLVYGDASAHGGVPWAVQRRNGSALTVNHIGGIDSAGRGLASIRDRDLGFVLNDDRSVSAVVHQYDRFPELREWASWLSGGEPWRRSGARLLRDAT